MSASGGRGGAWVVGQFLVIGALIVAASVGPRWPSETRWPLCVAAIVFVALGAVQADWAFRTLGASLTVYPEPRAEAELVERGPFAHVRHPVYGGLLLLFGGIGLATRPAALAVAAFLGIIWVGKARVEEQRLATRFSGYSAYAARVRRRFVPGVW